MNLSDRGKPQAADSQPASHVYGGAYYSHSSYGQAPYGGGPEVPFLGEISLQRMLRVVRKHKWAIAAVTFFGLLLGGYVLWRTPSVYRASSIIEMSVRRPRIMSVQSGVIDDNTVFQSAEVINTRLAKFNTAPMVSLAAEKFIQFTNNPAWPADFVKNLMAGTASPDRDRDSRIIRIYFKAPEPGLAIAGANAYAEASVSWSLEENRQSSESAVAWLQAQVIQQRKALEHADQALAEYRLSRKMDQMEIQTKTLQESLVSFNKSVVDLENNRVLAQKVLDFLQKMEIKPESAGNIPDGVPRSAEIKNILDRYLADLSAVQSLGRKYTELHPEMIAKQKDFEFTKSELLQALSRSRQTAASNLALWEEQGASLRKKIEDISSEASALELKMVEVQGGAVRLEREREAIDLTYKGVLNRIEESKLAADENTTTVKIVEYARGAARVQPKPAKILLTGLLLGLLGGVLLALVADFLSDHIGNVAEIENAVGMHVIGVVPHIEGENRQDLALTTLRERGSQVAEVFAGIRSLLSFLQEKDRSHIMLITSTAPEEGKTIVACNLAITFARSGARTLLIDFDLRRPRVGRVFGMKPDSSSLLHWLGLGQADGFEALPFHTACENLDVVGSLAGDGVNPADVVGSPLVQALLRWAVTRYDQVILDSPPYGAVSDALVLAGFVHHVVFISRPAITRKRALRRALDHFTKVQAKLAGAIINDIDYLKDRYFDEYGYHRYDYYKHYANQEQTADDKGRPA